ncbi:Protein 21.1 [Giardia lamblia P15]|uniref:Protein 21.1 n=1 Tax=Giardia intestinalis (strain P15) TaxID=658858 RepID=E1F7H5_GIAIA|nr:Protein 21.1 [Giardia lamblia P15]
MSQSKRYSNWREIRVSESTQAALAIRTCDRERVLIYSVNLPEGANVELSSLKKSMELVQSISACITYSDVHYNKEENKLLLERPTRHCISLYEYGSLSTQFLIPAHANEDVQRYRYAFNCSDGLSEIYLWKIVKHLLDTFVRLHDPYVWPDFRPRPHLLLSPSNVIVGPDDSFLLEAAGISHLLSTPSRHRHDWYSVIKNMNFSSHANDAQSASDNLSITTTEYVDDLFSLLMGEQSQDTPNIFELGSILRSNRLTREFRSENIFRFTQILTLELASHSLNLEDNDTTMDSLAFYSRYIDDDLDTRPYAHTGLPPISIDPDDVSDDFFLETCDYHNPDPLTLLTEDLTTKLDVFLLGITLIMLTVRNQCRHSIVSQIINNIKALDSWRTLIGNSMTKEKMLDLFQPVVQSIVAAGYSSQLATFIITCLIPDPQLRPSMCELKALYNSLSHPILKNSWCLYSLFRSRSYNMSNTVKYEINETGVRFAKKATELMKVVRSFENDLIPHYLDDLLVVDVTTGRTALMVAVEKNNIDAIQHLLQEAGVELVRGESLATNGYGFGRFDLHASLYDITVSESAASGFTALTLAIKAKNTAAIKLLAPLEVGFGGFTSLMAAVVANDYHAVCLYRGDAGKYCEGTTALMLAVLFGHVKCCELLLCELYMTDTQGRTVLSYGASIRNPSANVRAALAYLAREWLYSAPVDPLITQIIATRLIDPKNSHTLVDSEYEPIAAISPLEIPVDGMQISAIVHALQLRDLHTMKALLPMYHQSTYQALNLLELSLKYKDLPAIELISEFLVTRGVYMKVSGSTGIKVTQHTPLMKAALKNDILGVIQHRKQYGRMIISRLYFLYVNFHFTISPLNPNQQVTALMMAAKKGHINCVKRLLYELGIRTFLGTTALMFAIRSKRLDCVRYLLPERSIYNVYGRTPLMIAAEVGFPEAIDLLRPDTRMTDNSGETALLIALVSKNADCVALLQDQIGHAGVTQLMVYAALGNAEAIKACLETETDKDQLLRKKTLGDWSSLMFAVLYNNLECAQLLMGEAGISTKNKYTALLLAAHNRCYGAIPRLLDESDAENMTELMAYAAIGDLDNVNANLRYAKRHNVLGWTALMYAAAAGHANCVSALLEEITLTDTDNETALMKAAENGNVGCVMLLLTLVSQRSSKGHTALMKAAKNGCVDCIPLLSNELTIKDNKNRTVMMHAASFGQLGFLKALPPDGVLDRDISDRTAKELAQEYGHVECANYLHSLETAVIS